MSLQLIFVVETNKTCKSDWIYIKDTIDYFFEYDRTAIKLTPVYMDKAVDITVGNIQEKADSIFGTAYEHILLNGLEILSRFASIANITEQKKLVVLMIKIIDADVVRRFRVLNDWIRQVMNVLDERVKISMLNELLQCSGKKKSDVA